MLFFFRLSAVLFAAGVKPFFTPHPPAWPETQRLGGHSDTGIIENRQLHREGSLTTCVRIGFKHDLLNSGGDPIFPLGIVQINTAEGASVSGRMKREVINSSDD